MFNKSHAHAIIYKLKVQISPTKNPFVVAGLIYYIRFSSPKKTKHLSTYVTHIFMI